MTNPYAAHYENQAGNGISEFSGMDFQRGYGWASIGNIFGKLYRSLVVPAAKYLGKKVLSTGVDVGKDALAGENVKESAKKRFNEMLDNIKEQKGAGRRKKRKSIKRKVYKKKGAVKRKAKASAKRKKR